MSKVKITQQSGLFIIHFLEIENTNWDTDGINAVSAAYRRACNFAVKYGGKKYHNRSYGGGIAFNCEDTLKECVNAAKNC